MSPSTASTKLRPPVRLFMPGRSAAMVRIARVRKIHIGFHTRPQCLHRVAPNGAHYQGLRRDKPARDVVRHGAGTRVRAAGTCRE